MVLVTGGTGFIGAYIIKELVEKNYSVRAIRRSKKLPFYIPQSIFDKCEWVEGDVLDIPAIEHAMNDVDVIIHVAGVVSFLKKERAHMYKVNIEGTTNMVNLALEKNVHRFVHISSVSALGRTVGGSHVNEEKKWEDNKVNTHYGRSKYKAELEVWRAIGEGLNAVIVNPTTILGYGDWNSSSCALFKKVYEEFSWYVPGINGFADVEDVARTTVLLMESNISEERFIINAENWSFKKLQDTMADGFNKKHPSKEVTPFLMTIARRMEAVKSFLAGKTPLLTKETAKVGFSKTYFENDKILKALPGFSFVPLEETIKKACEKYLGMVNAVQPIPNKKYL